MKKILVIIFCACICCEKLFSQHIYFGYPPDSVSLEKKDRIIVNVPIFNVDHKYFLYEHQFKDFAHLLETHQTDYFCVEINYFFTLDSLFAKYSSDKLCENFKQMMFHVSNQTNFKMKSNGCSYPIYFLRDKNYIHYNTRIEIVVE